LVYLFYKADPVPPASPEPAQSPSRRYTLWRPSPTRLVPVPGAGARTLVWWLFHYGRVFTNRDYCVLLVREGDKFVHRAIVSPRYFRFPFMARDDLQVGDVWTAPSQRGRGIASSALRHIIAFLAKPGRRFWYVTTEDNLPSRRAAEKAGFRCVAEGTREPRLGFRILGQYRITSPKP